MLSMELRRRVMEYVPFLFDGVMEREKRERMDMYLELLMQYDQNSDIIYGMTDTHLMVSFSRLVRHVLSRFRYTRTVEMEGILLLMRNKKMPIIMVPVVFSEEEDESRSFSLYFEQGELHSTSIAYSLLQSCL